jgi:hypothetical protein
MPVVADRVHMCTYRKQAASNIALFYGIFRILAAETGPGTETFEM